MDLRNTEKRLLFLKSFPVVRARTIHKLAGRTATNSFQAAASIRNAQREYRCLSVPGGIGGQISLDPHTKAQHLAR